VFKNRVLRAIFGRKSEEETREWRKFHNEDPHNVYSSPVTPVRVTKLRRLRWVVSVARMGEMRNAYANLVRKFVGKRLCRRSWRKYKDNIKVYLINTGCEDVDWIHLAQDRDQ
jgi:hypothetical protein